MLSLGLIILPLENSKKSNGVKASFSFHFCKALKTLMRLLKVDFFKRLTVTNSCVPASML